jgi:hypothetical protein
LPCALLATPLYITDVGRVLCSVSNFAVAPAPIRSALPDQGQRSTINLDFSDKRYADYVKSGVPFHQYVQPKADATTLRILVEDPSTAEVGSLMIPLFEIK